MTVLVAVKAPGAAFPCTYEIAALAGTADMAASSAARRIVQRRTTDVRRPRTRAQCAGAILPVVFKPNPCADYAVTSASRQFKVVFRERALIALFDLSQRLIGGRR